MRAAGAALACGALACAPAPRAEPAPPLPTTHGASSTEAPPAPARSAAPAPTDAAVDASDASNSETTDTAADAGVDPKTYVKSAAATRLRSGREIPGPCVDPLAHAAYVLGGFTPDTPAKDAVSESKQGWDLDGDGTREFVVDGGAARWQRTYHLYLRRGSCGHYLGSIRSSETPRLLTKGASGLREVHTADDECPLLEDAGTSGGYCETIWGFDGKAYVRLREKPASGRPAGIDP